MYFSQFSLDKKARKANSQRPQDQKQVAKFGWDTDEVKWIFFPCSSSSHSLKSLAWDLPFSGISFTFFHQLKGVMESKIVFPEMTKLFCRQKWRKKANSLAVTRPVWGIIHFLPIPIMIAYPSQSCFLWENWAGEISFWLVIRHKRKCGLSYPLIPFPLC